MAHSVAPHRPSGVSIKLLDVGGADGTIAIGVRKASDQHSLRLNRCVEGPAILLA